MTDAEMVSTISTLIDDARFDRFIDYYLLAAKSVVIARLFPYNPDAEWADVPKKHHARTCEIAVYLLNRRGGEGETSHSESGVSRSYESSGVPESYLAGMVPYVGVPS